MGIGRLCVPKIVLDITLNNMRYNERADDYLKTLYTSVGATTWEQKYNTLCLRLDIKPQNQSFSHDPSWEQKAAMMEYELLDKMRLIQLVLV